MERKVATVLFADLVGSTGLGEDDPERTRVLLDRFFAAMAEEVERVGGTVEKFAGDAVMAAFGAPAALEDHAERALHAALAMRVRLPQLSDRLELRIGVNTGEVVVDPDAHSSFVTGDAVNVCARLEQNAEPGEILVGERTVLAARGAFEFDGPRRIDAKGKRDGVVCHRLLRALTLMRPRGASGLSESFVGRSAELDRLRAAYRRTVATGEPHVVLIVGDAGVGKTRLVRELWGWLGEQPEQPLRRTGRCLAYGSGITYWPLREILHEQFGLQESESAAARERLGDREILGLALGLDVAGDLHPLAARDRLRDAWVDLLEEMASERLVALLFEDVHWAEEPLLELLERTLRDVRGPVLVLATARPDLQWSGGRRNASTLALEPLDREAAAEMLAAVPDEARELIVSRAEGNPFYVEELVGSLIDHGYLARSNGGWTAHDLEGGLVIPDSVHGVVAARIDLLPAAEKEALQAASVVGRVFWDGPVRELIERDDADFGLLEERDFIRRRHGSSLAGELEFAIKHALTREVAYASIPKARRARLHAAFAAWLERLAESRDEVASLLAHHYAEAVRPEDADLAWGGAEAELASMRARAVDWLERAAELALGRYELEDALVLLGRAVELVDDARRESDLWRMIGRAHALRFEGESFWTAMQKSLAVCFDRKTCAESYADLALETTSRSGMWRKRPDAELVESWIDSALELAEPFSSARAKALVARAYWSPGMHAEAREASALAEQLGDASLRVNALVARSLVAFRASQYDDALTWTQRALDLAPEVTDPDAVASVLAIASSACSAVGRFREARRLAEEHDRVSAPLSPHHRVHGVAVLLEVEELTAAWEPISALAPRAEQDVEANLDTPCIRNARSLLVAALAARATGSNSEAARLERKADAVATEGYDFVLAAPRLRLALLRGDLDAADELLGHIDPARGQFWFGLAAEAARLDALVALGRREQVEEIGAAALKPGTYVDPFARRALGLVRRDRDLVREAAEAFETMHLGRHAAETRRLLST